MVAHTPNLEGQDSLAELSSRYVDIDALPWEKGKWDGIERKTLMEDTERGITTALIRWAPGARLPYHEHIDIEQSYVLEGSLCDDEGQYVWRPAGSRHRAWSPNGCLLLAMFLKPNRILEGQHAQAEETEAAET